MERSRSDDGSPGWAVASVILVATGLMALAFTARLAAPLGLRPALVLAELALVTPALVAWTALGRLRTLIGNGAWDPALGLRAAAAGGALWLLSLGLMDVQARLWSPPPGYLEAFRSLHAQLRPSGVWDALLSLAVIALAPAVCEEVVFRGVVLPSFPRARPLVALLASSLLFGLIHVDTVGPGVTFYRVPFAFAVGLGFGLLRLVTGTLAAPVFAHAALNALTFGAVPLFDEPSQATTLPHPGIGAVLALVGGAVFVSLLRALRRRGALQS
jgi:membrane protease YdiL (CAAX protease family)